MSFWKTWGEIVEQYLDKGSQLYVEGKLQTERENIKKEMTDIQQKELSKWDEHARKKAISGDEGVHDQSHRLLKSPVKDSQISEEDTFSIRWLKHLKLNSMTNCCKH